MLENGKGHKNPPNFLKTRQDSRLVRRTARDCRKSAGSWRSVEETAIKKGHSADFRDFLISSTHPPSHSSYSTLTNNLQTPLRRRHHIQRLDTDPLPLLEHSQRTPRHIIQIQRLKPLHKFLSQPILIPHSLDMDMRRHDARSPR